MPEVGLELLMQVVGWGASASRRLFAIWIIFVLVVRELVVRKFRVSSAYATA